MNVCVCVCICGSVVTHVRELNINGVILRPMSVHCQFSVRTGVRTEWRFLLITNPELDKVTSVQTGG